MKYARGFTLIEMAMVLLIVGLLVVGLLGPLSAQVKNRRVSETQKALEEIKEALLGYAAIHGALPCPTTQADPTNAGYGEPAASCATPVAEGYLPWKVLGVSEMDAWGVKRTSTASPWTGYWRYRVDRTFTSTTFDLNAGSTDSLVVQNNAGNALTSTPDTPVAIIYSAGPNTTPDGQNASFEATNGIYQQDAPTATFDDMTVWISRPALFNRMIAAKLLPRS